MYFLGRYSNLSGYPCQVLVPVGFILLSLTRFSYSHHPIKVCPLAFVFRRLLHGLLPTEAANIRSAAWSKTSFPTMHSTHCMPMPHPADILGHNGYADVLRIPAGCGLHNVRRSLGVCFCVHAVLLLPPPNYSTSCIPSLSGT